MARMPKVRSRKMVWLRRLGGFALAGAIGVGVAGAWQYHRYVVAEPGEHLSRDNLISVIAQESPVYYRDGTTRIGVFFEDEHRRLVPFDEMPLNYRAAIVAAEDAQFWSHPGFSVRHIVRAMRDNFRAGRLVAGGSTLTQQTAKNLFYRPDRSLKSKLIEALNALRLERHYSKSEILTFYANQFHVSGNGRGLGIAARHFFDKEPSELSVVECAFLAGLVKAPSYYDPFIGDQARRARSLERAHDRTRYVLRRLAEEDAEVLAGPYPIAGNVDEEAGYRGRVAEVRALALEAQRLLDLGFELQFHRGVFRFDSSAVLDEVARRLGEAPFAEVLRKAGVDDPATAGLKVITTLDVNAQRAATYGLWHHLTDVGVMLEATPAEAFVRSDANVPRFDPDRVPLPWEFRTGVVVGELELDGRRGLQIDLGGHPCVVDRAAIVRAAVAVHRGAEGSSNAKVPTAKVDAMVDALPAGSVVWVSVRSVDEAGAVCDLEVRPELQGATVVLENGKLRAMVGGNDNRNFNRAAALRQMGSTWKPLVTHAAMQLGWTPTDVLDNRRAVFPFSTTFYYPRPDHTPAEEVTMAWAVTRSENLASVWLLYHLLDRLDLEATSALADQLGLAIGEEEDEDDYRLRIQRAGVLPTPSRVREALFLEARQEVWRSLSQRGRQADGVGLTSLLYGWGYDAERRRAGSTERQALAWSWASVRDLRTQCGVEYRRLAGALRRGEVSSASELSLLRVKVLEQGALELGCGVVSEGFEVPSRELMLGAAEAQLATVDSAPFDVDVEQEVPAARRARLDNRALKRLRMPSEETSTLDGRMRAFVVDELASAIDRLSLAREVQGREAPGLYDPEVLYWHQDFRVLLALKVVKRLGEAYGVQTEIREVLSMPLGASEITLEEAAKVYEGITSGRAWRFPGEAVTAHGSVDVAEPLASTLLIAEIRDVDDRVLYRALPAADEVATAEVAAMSTDVLEHVVQRGTGRRARDQVMVQGHPIPLGGKTGTTNSFRNAAFMGVAPVVGEAGLDVGRAIVVGTYVGYDDNRSMKNGRIRLAGASGALPAWLSTVQGMAAAGMLGEPATPPGDDGWMRFDLAGLVRIAVDPSTGLAPEGDASDVAMVLSRPAPSPLAARDVHTATGGLRPVRVAPSTLHIDEWLDQRDEQLRGPRGRRSVWAPRRR